MSFGTWLLNLFFPPKCPFCGAVLDAPGICPKCRKALPWTQGAEREQTLPGGVRCVSPLWYEDLAREGILRYKFRGASGAADTLGDLLADCAAEAYSGDFDTVTWVPISPKRLKKRGYDQARLLAQAACRRWQTKPLPLLKKPRDNPPQSGLHDAAARRANVLGIYQADTKQTEGRRVLLIDDIVTTGATLAECARELKASGAAEVLCLTLACTRKN
ncbi:MAG: ComF family protein [Oscillibacter sp.]|jgi:ComF family protein|nr:ComF family protein [Oscillibacter sp.]